MPNLGFFIPLGALGLGGFNALALGFEVTLDSFGCFVQALVPEVAVVFKRGRGGGMSTHSLDDAHVCSGGDSHGCRGMA